MCIFSGESSRAVHVAGTRIFARASGPEQLLAYEMTFGADGDVAMVLPLPVVPGGGDDAVRFIDLSGYPTLFDDLAALFPADEMLSLSGDVGAPQASRQMLVVHRVGDFEASYVPSRRDFDRLDRRFRLAPSVWDALPGYRDHGFAVFKLFQPRAKRGLLERLGVRRPPREGSGAHRVHPMAFAFRTRWPGTLFYPTVHVHDGTVRPEAVFDHELYCQRADPPPPTLDEAWERGRGAPFPRDSRGVLEPSAPYYRRRLHGTLANADVHA